MRFLAAAATLALTFGTAAADPAARAQAPAAAAPAKKVECKTKMVGKGLDRHPVCVIEQAVVVSTNARPQVIVVPQDPRSIVGRPKQGDRLSGLSHTLR